MGAWSTSITGNDTAQDLLSEYQVAFYYYDVETAILKIDQYVRSQGIDEADKEEWCNYYYSLADFMWKKGILTDKVKNTAVKMIDDKFGLELWAESGNQVLKKRLKALSEFKEKLLSPLPAKKKININLHLNPIFESGDIVAFQLKTSDKIYLTKQAIINRNNKPCFDEDFFNKADGKYVVVRKLYDDISYRSHIAPEVADHWAVFQLYSKIYDHIPDLSELKGIKWANTGENFGKFICESSLSYFKKRKYCIIGKDYKNITIYSIKKRLNTYIFFSINKPHYNADTLIINAIIKK